MANSGSAPEQQKDGSQKLLVAGRGGTLHNVIFPRDGAKYVKTFLKDNDDHELRRPVRFGKPTLLLGRGYDPKTKAYTW